VGCITGGPSQLGPPQAVEHLGSPGVEAATAEDDAPGEQPGRPEDGHGEEETLGQGRLGHEEAPDGDRDETEDGDDEGDESADEPLRPEPVVLAKGLPPGFGATPGMSAPTREAVPRPEPSATTTSAGQRTPPPTMPRAASTAYRMARRGT
jgi:hypothetical protein